MPNIEIHGLSRSASGELYLKLEEVLKSAPYAKEVVVTMYDNRVVTLLDEGIQMPFLRICVTPSSADGLLEDIQARIALLNMDTEILMLHGFLPKQE